jgi:hypothetical protein
MIRTLVLLLPGSGYLALGGLLFFVARRSVARTRPGMVPRWARRIAFLCASLIVLVGLGLLALGAILSHLS